LRFYYLRPGKDDIYGLFAVSSVAISAELRVGAACNMGKACLSRWGREKEFDKLPWKTGFFEEDFHVLKISLEYYGRKSLRLVNYSWETEWTSWWIWKNVYIHEAHDLDPGKRDKLGQTPDKKQAYRAKKPFHNRGNPPN